MQETRSGGRGAVLGLAVGLAATAAMSVVFVISFAAIIYAGPLDQFLSRGIGLSLAGAALMALIGSLASSYRGTVCQPQDVTTILLAIAAAAIAAGPLRGEALFATVATLIVVASVVTGFAAYALGRLGLGFLARFIPFPVLAGFLAATGYLLTLGALGMVLGTPVDLYTLPALVDAEALLRWLPWMAAAAAITVLTRLLPHPMTLPGLVMLVSLAFYGLLFANGGTLASAAEAGLLLGPFDGGGFVAGLDPAFPLEADLRAIAGHSTTLFAVVGMAVLGTLLNATGLGLSLNRDIDADRDLRAVGLSNLAGGVGGGLVGYHLLAETLFATRMGITGRLAGLAAAAGCVLALVFGGTALSVLPAGLFAVVVAYLGLDLLYHWLWVERRELPLPDYLLVLLILVTAAAVGFLQALALGLLAAALLFIYSYARIDPVRLRSTLATRRSSVERGAAAEAVLAAAGESTVVYDLSGYLFFGTVSQLEARVREEIASHPDLERVILDFARVPNLDASAAFGLGTLASRCEAGGVALWITGADRSRQSRFPAGKLASKGVRLFPDLAEALELAEEDLLARAADARKSEGFLEDLRQAHPEVDPAEVFEAMTLGRGAVLVEEGTSSDALYILISGALQAEVRTETGAGLVVARFRPGALVGEIAHYAQAPRSATVRATEVSKVLRVDAGALGPGGTAHALSPTVHRLAAGYLARRVMRMNRFVQASGH